MIMELENKIRRKKQKKTKEKKTYTNIYNTTRAINKIYVKKKILLPYHAR